MLLLLLLVVKEVLDAGVPLVSSVVVVVLPLFTSGCVAFSIVIWSVGEREGDEQVVGVKEERCLA